MCCNNFVPLDWFYLFVSILAKKMGRDEPCNCEEMEQMKKKQAAHKMKFDKAYGKEKAAKTSAVLPKKPSANDKKKPAV